MNIYSDVNLKIILFYEIGLKQSVISKIFNLSRQRVGQIVHNYKNIHNSYKSYIVKYYDSMCVICDKMVNLEVHHIDNNSQNNNITNLVLLCRKCHKDVHKIDRDKNNFIVNN